MQNMPQNMLWPCGSWSVDLLRLLRKIPSEASLWKIQSLAYAHKGHLPASGFSEIWEYLMFEIFPCFSFLMKEEFLSSHCHSRRSDKFLSLFSCTHVKSLYLIRLIRSTKNNIFQKLFLCCFLFELFVKFSCFCSEPQLTTFLLSVIIVIYIFSEYLCKTVINFI